jgi:predicted nuclease of predicted toxin-antitoxin system
MGNLKFLIDANMPRLITYSLIALGYDVVDIRDIERPGVDDDHIFEVAQQEGRIILTRDQDFGNVLLYPPGLHAGIIVLKTRSQPSESIRDLLISFLAEISEYEICGSLIILEKHRYRIRRGSGS